MEIETWQAELADPKHVAYLAALYRLVLTDAPPESPLFTSRKVCRFEGTFERKKSILRVCGSESTLELAEMHRFCP